MIHDYASKRSNLKLIRHRHHRRLAFVSLIFCVFCATTIYASFRLLRDNLPLKGEIEIAVESPHIVWLKPLPNSTTVAETSSLESPQFKASIKRGDYPPDNLTSPETYVNEFSSFSSDQLPRVPVNPESSPNSSQKTKLHWIEEKIRKGDSLARIFTRLGIASRLVHQITHSSKVAAQLALIRPGETLKVLLDEEKNLHQLIYHFNPVKSLQITAVNDAFTTRVINREYEIHQTNTSGIITDSLFTSAREAGLPDALIMDLAYIFGWDIDFALEIRTGDTFSVIYEEKYLDGQKQQHGEILAAEFNNRGKRFRAVRFVDEHGRSNYFSPNGRNMRKAFLRAPVDFSRISSKFNPTRWHPVLGKKRPHRGVDYAAKAGTPVKAAGNGKVIYRGPKGGYGKTLIIQHANHYTTLYAHLSKFRKSVKKGSRVQQGDIIGYVGMTGLATGPHLHYEFRVNNVHRNPLTVRLPAAAPIAAKYSNAFKEQSTQLLAKLNAISSSMLAETSRTHSTTRLRVTPTQDL